MCLCCVYVCAVCMYVRTVYACSFLYLCCIYGTAHMWGGQRTTLDIYSVVRCDISQAGQLAWKFLEMFLIIPQANKYHHVCVSTSGFLWVLEIQILVFMLGQVFYLLNYHLPILIK